MAGEFPFMKPLILWSVRTTLVGEALRRVRGRVLHSEWLCTLTNWGTLLLTDRARDSHVC